MDTLERYERTSLRGTSISFVSPRFFFFLSFLLRRISIRWAVQNSLSVEKRFS